MTQLTPEFMREYRKQEEKKERAALYRRFIDQPEIMQIGNVVIVHGYRGQIRAQHFKDLSNSFDDADFNVGAFDLPNFGKSKPLRPELAGQIVSFGALVRSTKSMLFSMLDSKSKSRVPTILVGYSIGGLVILRLLQIYPYLQNYVAGIVLVSTPLEVDHNARKELLRWKKVVKPLFKIVARMRPGMPVSDYEPDEFSEQDPAHYKGAMNAWTANQILIASEKTRARIKRIRVPIYFVHGEDDTTALLKDMEWAFGEVGTPRDDKEKIVYPNIGHLLIQKHRRAIEDIVKWSKVRAKLSPDPIRIHRDQWKPEERLEQLVHICLNSGRQILLWFWNVLCDLLRSIFRRKRK